MPIRELLIRKIYTKFAGDQEVNSKIYPFNLNSNFRNLTTHEDITKNKINIHLYSKVNQTPINALNASLYNALIKKGYSDQDAYYGKDSSSREDKLYDINEPKLNDSFGGVWSLFTIKMNFID